MMFIRHVIRIFKNGDIEINCPSSTDLYTNDINVQNYVFVILILYIYSKGAVIRGSSVFMERCEAMLARLQEVCPQLSTDGLNNIWIIKPGAKSRGIGETFIDIKTVIQLI